MVEKELPLVSIIAIAYNHEQFLKDTLDSVLNQTYPNIELIIIDSASSDSSAARIQDWVKDKSLPIQTVFHQDRRSITQNANVGLQLAKGKYYQILSCDDNLEPEKIKNQVEVFLHSDEKLAMVYCDAVKIDDKGFHLPEPTFFEERAWQVESQLPSGSIFPILLQDYFIVAPTVLVDLEKVRELGAYDEHS
ncbi:MAG: glycosyltransferase, partial [Reichenbachiella sp.]|uniref:glycosyltransferase n=1 Tax=Reichenbachiella sp. TaxID=2184521 RepID=UPI003298BAA4